MTGDDKCTEELKLRTSSELRCTLERLAYASDRSLSEYIRHVLSLHAFGHARRVVGESDSRQGRNGT